MKTTGNFSSARLWRLVRFYWPALRRQAAVYAAVSLMSGLLVTFAGYSVLMLLFAAHVLLLMLWLGPLALTSRGALAMEVALPATGGEKTVCLMAYTFVFLPLLVFAPFALCFGVSYGHLVSANPDVASFLNMVRVYFAAYAPYHLLAWAMLMAVCLLGVSSYRRRRVLRSVLTVFGAYVLLSLMSVAGLIWSIDKLYEQGFIGHKIYSIDNELQLYADAAEFIPAHPDCLGSASVFGIAEVILLSVALVALIVAVCRTIRNRQI